MKTLDPFAGIAAFLNVAQSLSFSQAAEDLGMSRATVSAQIQALEKRLGTRLLQRTTRAVTLTEAGAAYRDALQGVLPQIREAERAAGSFQHEAVGRMRISAAPDLGPDHIAPAIAEFLKLNPGLSIDLDLSLDVVNLIEGSFDLAIRGTVSVEPNIVTRQIGASPMIACASPDYLERFGAPERPDDLIRHACLNFSRLRWGRVWQFQKGDASLRVPLLPKMECNDSRSLVVAAVAGAGIMLAPAFVVGPQIRSGKLVPVLQDWSVATIPIHAVYPANRHIAMKVKSFVSFLVEHLAGHPDLRAE